MEGDVGASTGALWMRHLQQIPPTMQMTIPTTRVRGTSVTKPPRVKQVAGRLTCSTTFSVPFMVIFEYLLLQKSALRQLTTIETYGLKFSALASLKHNEKTRDLLLAPCGIVRLMRWGWVDGERLSNAPREL